MSRRRFLEAAGTAAAVLTAPAVLRAQSSRKLRCAVGPFLPTPEDTRNTYRPFFNYLGQQLGREVELAVTTDWAGLAVAMGSGNLDVAWMGPWGYVLANAAAGCRAIATVKYEDKPTYQAIIVARPTLKIARFPEDSKGLSISFADVGSTSGWLMPHYYAKEKWQIDPRSYWKYTEGAAHPANEIAVAAGQVDLATDFDRNRNAMIDAGRIEPNATQVVWRSDPLPNDALAIAADFPAELGHAVQKAALQITNAQALQLLPKRYTGFVTATHNSYAMIENAGRLLGRLKRAG